MTFSPEELDTIVTILRAPTDSFAALVRLSRLDPAHDFKDADLRDVNFGEDDLAAFSFADADLRGADFSHAQNLHPSMFIGSVHNETTKWPVGFRIRLVPKPSNQTRTTTSTISRPLFEEGEISLFQEADWDFSSLSDWFVRSPVEAGQPDDAAKLQNLGLFYANSGRIADAEEAFTRVLALSRAGVWNHLGYDESCQADAQRNLGILYADSGRLYEAENAFTAALAIYRKAKWHGEVAATLYQLGLLYLNSDRRAGANKALTEAIAIYRQLAIDDPTVYARLVASASDQLRKLQALPPSLPGREEPTQGKRLLKPGGRSVTDILHFLLDPHDAVRPG